MQQLPTKYPLIWTISLVWQYWQGMGNTLLCDMCLVLPQKRKEILVKNILSSPRGPWAFDELRRYHTRPLRLNWGPKNVHFGKTHFRDPDIDARVFIFIWKFIELPGAIFLCLECFTKVPKNGPKNGPKFKKHRKMTKTVFLLGGHLI